MNKLAAQKIRRDAFNDELEKLGYAGIVAGLARLLPAIGRIGARVLPKLTKGVRYAAKTAPGKILKTAPKTTLKKPSMVQRWGGQAVRNTKLLFKNPTKLMKEQWHGMRHFTTSAKSTRIRGGKYHGRFGAPKKVVGYNRQGQAMIKRSPLGTATIGLGFSGAGMGALEFATNKHDAQGRKRSIGQRLGRAGSQGLLWTVAPQAAMGYYGLKFVHDIAKNSRQTKTQMNFQNQPPPMGLG